MKLRKWVKITIGLIFIIGLLILDNIYTNKTIETCINNGVDTNICEELRK